MPRLTAVAPRHACARHGQCGNGEVAASLHCVRSDGALYVRCVSGEQCMCASQLWPF